MIQKLIKERDSASAVMSLWDSGSGDYQASIDIPQCGRFAHKIARFGRKAGESDHDYGGSPCLNHIWIRIVNDRLSLTAVFRSNDMFSAWPSNAMGLRLLQQHIVEQINNQSKVSEISSPSVHIPITEGELIILSQSAHIYDDCWQDAQHIIDKHYSRIVSKDLQSYNDACGNFVISIDLDNIIVQQFDKDDIFVRDYKSRKALFLIKEITLCNPNIDPYHIGYLGIELSKAENALTFHLTYQQK